MEVNPGYIFNLGKQQMTVSAALNTPIDKFATIEDYWKAQDAVVDFLEEQRHCGFPSDGAIRYLGSTFYLCPAQSDATLLMAYNCLSFPMLNGKAEKIITEPMSEYERLVYDLHVVWQGYVTDPYVVERELHRKDGFMKSKRLNQNHRYPAAVWRAADAIGLCSEAAVVIVAALMSLGDRARVCDIFNNSYRGEAARMIKTADEELAGIVLRRGEGGDAFLELTGGTLLHQGTGRPEADAEQFIRFAFSRFPERSEDLLQRNEKKVLDDYRTEKGRTEIEDILLSDFSQYCCYGEEADYDEFLKARSVAVMSSGESRYEEFLSAQDIVAQIRRKDIFPNP